MVHLSKKVELAQFKDHQLIVGVDEVGVGCLAGPVVACAVSIDQQSFKKLPADLYGVRDSKLLSAKQRKLIASKLKSLRGMNYRITLSKPETIDSINIYNATRQAMHRAVLNLTTDLLYLSHSFSPPQRVGSEVWSLRSPRQSMRKRRGTMPALGSIIRSKNISNRGNDIIVLIDGPRELAGLNLPQKAIIKGDRKIFTIACASILAKVYRDRMMVKYAKRFPNYGFEKHKGYGTKLHVARLNSYGPSPIHRQSFSPVSEVL